MTVIQLNPCAYCPGRIKEGQISVIHTDGKTYHAGCLHNMLETGTVEKETPDAG